MSESNVLKRILLRGSELGATLFRNNGGIGWAGKMFRPTKRMQVWVDPCDVVVRSARPLHAGLCTGSGDIIGFLPVKITPAMVGRTLGIFTSIEAKYTDGRPSTDQINFMNQCQAAGCIAGIVYSESEAENMIKSALNTISSDVSHKTCYP